MTLPVMEPDLDAAVLKRWAQTVDEGPFSSLCWGERVAFNNPDSVTLLGALSAWTDRVPLVTTVVVPQLHDPVMLAKALATGDMLCGGRLTVGIGVGGRQEDYRAVGADLTTMTMRDMAERVAVMKRVWAGEKITDSVLPVGPSAGAGGWAAAAGRRDRAEILPATPRGGPTVWPASLSISTSPSRTSFLMSPAPPGPRPASPNRIWRRRFGSRSAMATNPAPRSTGICATT